MSLASFRKSRKAHKRTRRARRNPIFLAKRNPSRRRRSVRRNPIFLAKRNPAKRRSHARRRARRNPGFGALLLKRNPLFVARSNPKHRRKHRKAHSKHRRNPSHRRRVARRNPSGMLGKIPVIGPVLASASAFLMPAAFGAVSVEPVLAVTQFAAPYLPAWMPYSATVAAGGVLLGAVVKRYGPFSAATNEKLAVACAAGSGAVAYYEWRNGAGAAPVAAKAGADVLAGYGSPIAAAIMGSGQMAQLAASAGFAGAEMEAVSPLVSVGGMTRSY